MTTRDRRAVGNLVAGLVGCAREEMLGHPLAGEHGVPGLDAGVDDADGLAGARFRAGPVLQLELGIGAVRPDRGQSPLVLEILVAAMVLLDRLTLLPVPDRGKRNRNRQCPRNLAAAVAAVVVTTEAAATAVTATAATAAKEAAAAGETVASLAARPAKNRSRPLHSPQRRRGRKRQGHRPAPSRSCCPLRPIRRHMDGHPGGPIRPPPQRPGRAPLQDRQRRFAEFAGRKRGHRAGDCRLRRVPQRERLRRSISALLRVDTAQPQNPSHKEITEYNEIIIFQFAIYRSSAE